MKTNSELMGELLWCLTEFMDAWNGGWASRGGKRAGARRAAMWTRANAVLEEAKAQGLSSTRVRSIAAASPK
jgi:hypothetical protein